MLFLITKIYQIQSFQIILIDLNSFIEIGNRLTKFDNFFFHVEF